MNNKLGSPSELSVSLRFSQWINNAFLLVSCCDQSLLLFKMLFAVPKSMIYVASDVEINEIHFRCQVLAISMKLTKLCEKTCEIENTYCGV
jgi:hypothetical protein